MDKFKIDSHKLMYHIPRVNDWLDGGLIYPIYMEVSPMGLCNHRCVFCALDFMEYQSRKLDADILKERLYELGELGLKSIMFAGEGEPLLHKRIAEIIGHTKKAGIDVAMTSNAVLLKKFLAEQIIGKMEWLKVSINAGTADTYANIHRTKPADFDTVIENMTAAAELRERNGYCCVLGMQMLLLPENTHEAITLAILARDIGMDYLVIKPYSQHLQSKTDKYKGIQYGDMMDLAEELKGCNSPGFQVIFRERSMKKWDDGERNYKHCLALPFWSYMDAGGNIWGCSMFLGDEKFCYGNINEMSFKEIWEGSRRRESLYWVQEELDTSKCRVNCRMDEVNRYLWELCNPPEHVNFI